MQAWFAESCTDSVPELPLEQHNVYQQSVPNSRVLNPVFAEPCVLAEAIDWSHDPTDPDSVADPKAYALRWCSLFDRHTFFIGILTGAGFRPRSIERLAEHPVWVAQLTQGSAFLAEDVRVVMRDLRALFRTHGVRLDRESPSVGIRRNEIRVSWLADEGVPGKLTWKPDGQREEFVYEIPEPLVLEDLPIEDPAEDELAPAR